MAVAPRTEPLRPPRKRRVNESLRTWRWGDRIAFVLCWASGLALCAIAGAIVVYMAVKGLQYLNLELLTSRPQPSADQKSSGGFLDPILGTVLLTVIGIAIATPIAVATAVWIVEYGRPAWLARAVESVRLKRTNVDTQVMVEELVTEFRRHNPGREIVWQVNGPLPALRGDPT